MKVIRTALPSVLVVEPDMFTDERGWFMESFNEQDFHAELKKINLPIPKKFVQDSHSCSKKGVLRGIHFQVEPHAQGKLVRVIQGVAFNVVVDVRPNSYTYGKHVCLELNGNTQRMLWIPEGFAHGFVALQDNTHFHYKTTGYYKNSHEASIRWDDPELAIPWPIKDQLVISPKDQMAPLLSQVRLERGAGLIKWYDFQALGDERGSLVAFELGQAVPLDIKRVYYLYGTALGISRGYHAHYNLTQLAICVAGRCRMVLDNGTTREETWLDNPTKGLLIENMIWREMHDFSSDCVLLVLATEHYDESDYIRDYQQFLTESRNAKR